VRNVSQSVREALFAQETDQVFVPVLTISHPEIAEPYRVVGNTQDLIKDGETYTAVPFRFELPDDQEDRIQTIKIQIENVSRTLVEMVRNISTAPDVSFEIVRTDEPEETIAGPWEMRLDEVSYNAITIEGELGRKRRLNVEFPKQEYAYLPQNFEGLF